MSWSLHRQGTRELVLTHVKSDFEVILRSYPAGTIEGEDVVAVQSRVVAALEALDLTPDSYFTDDVVVAMANGSHSFGSDKERPRSTSATFSVHRVPKK